MQNIENLYNTNIYKHPVMDAILCKLISHICHELASPCNAIGMAIDLLSNGEPLPEMLTILKQGSDTAQKKLKLFRTIFAPLNLTCISEVITTIKSHLPNPANKNYLLNFDYIDTPISCQHNGLTLISIELAIDILTRGGNISIETNPEPFKLTLTLNGPTIKLHEHFIKIIDIHNKIIHSIEEPNPNPEDCAPITSLITPRNVMVFILILKAFNSKKKVSIIEGEGYCKLIID